MIRAGRTTSTLSLGLRLARPLVVGMVASSMGIRVAWWVRGSSGSCLTRFELLFDRLMADGGNIRLGVVDVWGSAWAGKWGADRGERDDLGAGVQVGRRDDLLAVSEGPIRSSGRVEEDSRMVEVRGELSYCRPSRRPATRQVRYF